MSLYDVIRKGLMKQGCCEKPEIFDSYMKQLAKQLYSETQENTHAAEEPEDIEDIKDIGNE